MMKNILKILIATSLLSCSESKQTAKLEVKIDSIYINKVVEIAHPPDKLNYIVIFFHNDYSEDINLEEGIYTFETENYYFKNPVIKNSKVDNNIEMTIVLPPIEVHTLSLFEIFKKYESIICDKPIMLKKNEKKTEFKFSNKDITEVKFFLDNSLIQRDDSLKMNSNFVNVPDVIDKVYYDSNEPTN